MPPMSSASAHLAGFQVVISVPVAWGEMDAFAHVNNTVYFRWFESARIAYFDRVAFREPSENGGIGPILASTQCRFRRPLTYPDTVLIGARVIALEADRFTMEYHVVSETSGGLAAEGSGVVVAYDYEAGAKAAVPAIVVGNIRELDLLE